MPFRLTQLELVWVLAYRFWWLWASQIWVKQPHMNCVKDVFLCEETVLSVTKEVDLKQEVVYVEKLDSE